jgi:hypothetical protein
MSLHKTRILRGQLVRVRCVNCRSLFVIPIEQEDFAEPKLCCRTCAEARSH